MAKWKAISPILVVKLGKGTQSSHSCIPLMPLTLNTCVCKTREHYTQICARCGLKPESHKREVCDGTTTAAGATTSTALIQLHKLNYE